MPRRKNSISNGPSFFEAHEKELERIARRSRRQRALFIPRFLTQAASDNRLKGDAQDNAFAMAVHWADLETNGHLPEYTETSVDTQFLDQLFGALGYRHKTQSPDAFELQNKFPVPGVGIADGSLGQFPADDSPTVVIELKGAETDLDRDKSNGRTAVQQCWDYLNALPHCPWGIVSNFSTIRLYHRERGSLQYEEFTLQELRRRERFNEFYCIFERDGLLKSRIGQKSRASELLKKTAERQKEVGDELYRQYQVQRLELIEHLNKEENKDLDEAIRIAQKILDRIIFIAFCEDRDLLPEKSLENAKIDVRRYSRAKNPAWESFLDLFHAIDRGAKGKDEITAFNGGLFAKDSAIDALELEDEKWTDGFVGFGNYDFSEEVNVEVLGHIFERSITELEKLRVGGLYALKANVSGASSTSAKRKHAKPADDSPLSKMPKSAQRKRFGIYYTPPAFTGLIVERTVDALIKERFAELATSHKINPEARKNTDKKKLVEYWTACLEELKAITVCDPACGSGAFLIRAYEALDAHYKVVVHALAGAGLPADTVAAHESAIPDWILNRNLYGVDLSREAVEITQLALWIRSARRGKTLADLSHNIIWGNSLVSDAAVDPKALDWAATFPTIFGKGGPGGFSCVIGNPPWERVKVQNREFFALSAPEILETDNPAAMRRAISNLKETNPDLFQRYEAALTHSEVVLRYARDSGRFPLTGKGDTNLYMLFAELAKSIVSPNGLAGLLLPSGIATDEPTKEFFGALMESKRLVLLFDFENKRGHFEDVHRAFKFTALVFAGSSRVVERASFVFFARDVDEVAESNKPRRVTLTASDIALVNPNSKTCPIFRTERDADLTAEIYKRIPVLIDRNRRRGGNSWELKFCTAFHQSADAGLFLPIGGKTKSGKRTEDREKRLRVYEAKMVQAFDHRAASVRVESGNWARKGQKVESTPALYQNPEYLVQSRWEARESDVISALGEQLIRGFIAYKDISSPTNTRTLIAAALPWCGATHHLAISRTAQTPRRELCLLANFNAFALDYVVRQKLGGTTLTFFIMEQLPVLLPDTYADKCPWSKKETLERWISERVLKLSCTAEDMIPLAQACGFKGSRGDGVHIWKESERAEIRAELDAAYFHLYGIERDDAEYMLSTFTNTGLNSSPHAPREDRHAERDEYSWQPGGTGEMILEAYDRMR